MRVFATMAHFDPDGEVAPHVRRHIGALREVADRVVVVSTADLRPAHERWLTENVELVRRENLGYDFFSYRSGLLESGDLSGYDNVVICNDSYVGPVTSYRDILGRMAGEAADFWGYTRSTRIGPHVQSFFVSFAPWVVRSQAFRQFWQGMTPLSDRRQVILRYEIGLSKALLDAGFAAGSYFVESEADKRVARRRMLWWAWLRSQESKGAQRRKQFRKFAAEPWNPGAGLADRVLGEATLPIVKIDTLRYDPYGLGADQLLSACVDQYPDLFGDVPDYLQRTAKYYPPRPKEVLPEPWPAVRPLRGVVGYA